MDIKIVGAEPIQTNCYIIESGEKCIVFDCGGHEVVDYLVDKGISDVVLFLTHGHYDHIFGIDYLREKIKNVKIYALDEEKEVMEDEKKNCSKLFLDSYKVDGIEYIKDNTIIPILGYDIKIIHTPGHTKGSCCYYIEKEKVLFSGDTLFFHSFGRTDFPTGNIRDIVKSVGSRLMVLADDIKVYPGHGASTTIGEERKENEIVRTYNMREKWD